jgi:glycine dehydrogenase
VAHECILDLRQLKDTSGVMAEDVAKRLIDYGFHAPTLSFPVANTLMVEPTESERCRAGPLHRRDDRHPRGNPPVETGPGRRTTTRSRTRRTRPRACWPPSGPTLQREPPPTRWPPAQHKYWSPVGRVDNVYGDRNLFCSCVPVSDGVSRLMQPL